MDREITMKTLLVIFAVAATGLIVLDAFCQQAGKGDSIFNWQLKAPPSAAGYGSSPFEPADTSKENTTLPASPAENAPPDKQPAAEKKVTEHNKAILTIEPPPSPAAGYGSSPFKPVDTSKENTTSPSSPEVNAPADEQPAATEENSSGQSWSIKPPPSPAAGYGSPFKK